MTIKFYWGTELRDGSYHMRIEVDGKFITLEAGQANNEYMPYPGCEFNGLELKRLLKFCENIGKNDE